jgi:hypothetical protein
MTRVKKGQSGNPAGRPKGSLNPATRLRRQIADDLPTIIGTLVARAKDGDVQAAGVLLARCLPVLKPQTEAPEMPLTGTNLAERAESIASATLAGDLSPSTAAELMAVLAAQARIVESSELAERISRIEAALQPVENRK